MQQPEMGGNQSGPSMKQSMLTFGLLAIQMLVVDDPSVKGHPAFITRMFEAQQKSGCGPA